MVGGNYAVVGWAMTREDLEKLAAFEKALDALCAEHSVIFEHEDNQGAGLVSSVEPGEEGRCEIYLTWRDR